MAQHLYLTSDIVNKMYHRMLALLWSFLGMLDKPLFCALRSFWVDKSKKLCPALYTRVSIIVTWYLSSCIMLLRCCLSTPDLRPHFANRIERGAYRRKNFRISPSWAVYCVEHIRKSGNWKRRQTWNGGICRRSLISLSQSQPQSLLTRYLTNPSRSLCQSRL